MKKNYFLKQLLLLAFIVGFISCKKDLSPKSVEPENVVSELKELQIWYLETKNNENIEWGKSFYDDNTKELNFPIIQKMNSTNYIIRKYLSTKKINGEISGEIKYELERKENSNTKFEKISFSTSMENTITQKPINKNDLSSKGKIGIKFENRSNITNSQLNRWATLSEVPCGQTVYNVIVTYDLETGEIYSIDIVAILVGLCPTGGEGGGSSSPTSGPPDCSAAGLAAFAAQGQAVSGPLNVTTISHNETNWNRRYEWKIFQAGSYVLFSYEDANLKKVSYPNNYTRWEFQNVTHAGILEVGGSLGGTRTFSSLPPLYNISDTKLSVYVRIDFSVSNQVLCTNPVTSPIILAYNANKILNSPSNIVIL